MAKADMQLPDGSKVTIEGTPDEVAALLARLTAPEGGSPQAGAKRQRGSRKRTRTPKPETRKRSTGPTDYVRELIQDDFFKARRGLGDVQKKLEERAHIMPVTSLSPVLYRLVRNRELRRIKENDQWLYVNP